MRKLQKSLWHLKKMKNEVGPLKVTVKGQKGVFLTEDEEIEDDVNVQKDVQNKKDKRSHKVKEDKSKSLLRRMSPARSRSRSLERSRSLDRSRSMDRSSSRTLQTNQPVFLIVSIICQHLGKVENMVFL